MPDPITDEDIDRMDGFFDTVSYAEDREVKPWREVEATGESSDDAPDAEPAPEPAKE